MARLEVKKSSIKEFYDKRYEGEYMDAVTGFESYEVRCVLDEIPVKSQFILDYGCGEGRWVDLLSNRFSSAQIHGIDISDKAIEQAGRNFPQYKFLPFNGEVAPFEDNSFDLIFSYHVLEHVYDIKKTIADISRLLKKDGYLCIIFPCSNEDSFEERITRLVQDGKEDSDDGRKRFFYEDPGHYGRMKSEEIIKSFAHYNISIYKEFYTNQFWGAIDWIGKSGRDFISEIFNYRRGVNLLAKLKLLFLKGAFHILTISWMLYSFGIVKYMRSDRGLIKKMALVILLPLKVIAILFWRIIELFSFLEWHFFKRQRNGSTQYLIFKKKD